MRNSLLFPGLSSYGRGTQAKDKQQPRIGSPRQPQLQFRRQIERDQGGPPHIPGLKVKQFLPYDLNWSRTSEYVNL